MLFTVTRKEGGMVSEYIRGGEDSFYIHYTAILGLRRHITFPFLPPSYSHFQMSTLKYKAAGGVLCINSYQWRRHFPPVKRSSLWEYRPSKHTYWGFPGCFPNSVPSQTPSSSAQKKTCGRQLIKLSSRSWPSSVVKESGITLSGWCRTVISAYLRRGQTLRRGLFMKIFRPLGPEVKVRCPICWGQKGSPLNSTKNDIWAGGSLWMTSAGHSFQKLAGFQHGTKRTLFSERRFWLWRLQIWTDLEEKSLPWGLVGFCCSGRRR